MESNKVRRGIQARTRRIKLGSAPRSCMPCSVMFGGGADDGGTRIEAAGRGDAHDTNTKGGEEERRGEVEAACDPGTSSTSEVLTPQASTVQRGRSESGERRVFGLCIPPRALVILLPSQHGAWGQRLYRVRRRCRCRSAKGALKHIRRPGVWPRSGAWDPSIRRAARSCRLRLSLLDAEADVEEHKVCDDEGECIGVRCDVGAPPPLGGAEIEVHRLPQPA